MADDSLVVAALPEPRLVGYARVSTDDQDLSLQIDALTKQDIPETTIFKDKLSGAKTKRLGLTKCLAMLRKGDTLVVWRLDRLGRSMRHLITVVDPRLLQMKPKSCSPRSCTPTRALKLMIFDDICKTLRLSRSTFYRYVRL